MSEEPKKRGRPRGPNYRPRCKAPEDRKKPGPKPGSSGSRKGIPNKFGADVKAMTLEALEKLGGVTWLVELGEDNPKSFAALLAKMIPATVNAAVTADVKVQQVDEDAAAFRSRLIQSAIAGSTASGTGETLQ